MVPFVFSWTQAISELCAIGPVQFGWPRGVADPFCSIRVLGAFCRFSPGKAGNTEFTEFSSVQTPEILKIWFFGIGPDLVSSDNMSNGIFKRTRQKQNCATLIWNASKTRCTPAKARQETSSVSLSSPFLKTSRKTRYTPEKRDWHEFW